MFSHGFMSFAAIGVTVACLVIMGTFSLVAYNANENLKDLQKENAVLAFVDENLSDNEAKALQSKLEKIPGAADCTFVSRQEARDSYVEQYDEDDLYSDLDPSIFRHRYVIHLTDAAQMQQVVSDLEATPGIVKVRADETISVRNVASLISIALIAVLLVISVFIISNTIKLTTFDRRDEIAIMKMVGATDGFIRWPFVYEGLLIGQLLEVLLDQTVLHPVLADLTGLTVGDELIGIQSDVEVEVVVDHDLNGLALDALALVLVDGLAVELALGTEAVAIDTAVLFELLRKLLGHLLMMVGVDVTQGVLDGERLIGLAQVGFAAGCATVALFELRVLRKLVVQLDRHRIVCKIDHGGFLTFIKIFL